MKYIIFAILVIGVNGYAIDKETIKQLITIEAIHQGVSPKLAISVATVESRLNPNARGSKGEVGLFQLLPGSKSTVRDAEIGYNIIKGISEIKYWKTHCPVKDQETFVICFNGGFRHPKYPLLHPYYKKVMQAMR